MPQIPEHQPVKLLGCRYQNISLSNYWAADTRKAFQTSGLLIQEHQLVKLAGLNERKPSDPISSTQTDFRNMTVLTDVTNVLNNSRKRAIFTRQKWVSNLEFCSSKLCDSPLPRPGPHEHQVQQVPRDTAVMSAACTHQIRTADTANQAAQ